MDDALGVVEEVSNEKSDADVLKKYDNVVDPDFVDRGFTCDAIKNKRFFVDDTEPQNVTKLPQVKTTPAVWSLLIKAVAIRTAGRINKPEDISTAGDGRPVH